MEKIILEQKFRERRKFPRFTVAIPLTYSPLNSHRVNKTQTQDISVCGIGFIAKGELTVDAFLDLWLNMPDNGQQIHIKGEVVWSRRIEHNNYRVGVDLKDSTLEVISIVLRIIQSKF